MKPDIAARFFNTPIALRPDQVVALMAEIRKGANKRAPARAVREDVLRPYVILESNEEGGGAGIAYIPVHGVLTQRAGWDWFSATTGYDAIRFAFVSAMNDPEVAGVLLDIDSPGGEVSGCFDLVDLIYSARGTKPVFASLNESAYSAGFAIASAADRIFIPRTGGVGSVGCIMLHMDMSRWLEDFGMTPTIIQFGERKADGTDVEPLSKIARARFQADIDTMGELFVATVARNRKLKPAAVRSTQAATYLGAQGVEVGFADDVKSPLEAIRALQRAL